MNAIFLLALAAAPGADAAGPLAVKEPVIDCGKVRAGLPLVRKFRVTNMARTVLTVTEVAPVACGCVRPTMAVRALLPGETTEVAVEVNTLGQAAGPNVWRAVLRYRTEPAGKSAAVEGEQFLTVRGEVIREITVEPVSLSLITSGPVSHPITITDSRAKPLTLTGVRCTSPHLRAELADGTTDDKGQRVQRVTVSVLDTCPPGPLADLLVLETNDPEYRSFHIPVRVTRRASAGVEAIPEQASIRLAPGQSSGSMLLRLRDAAGGKVVVDRVESDQAVVRVKWASGPESMATVRVTVEPGTGPREGRAAVQVHLSGPAPQVVSIPVSWRE